ncbi:hypothetical protein HUA78_07470 [Myxococcus sp. CA033]|uniref:hypothetical protein n=1 Tax=Myxococcus sp. CA033 TaxID=2741516 RepID=UPI00157B0A14|nr:hypothetical protein [Myxococcus sp. CA033]NTX34272.1 hypothetical protein [Myxococcus sp. CA033]
MARGSRWGGRDSLLAENFRIAQPYNGGHAPMPVFSHEFLVTLTALFDPGLSEL